LLAAERSVLDRAARVAELERLGQSHAAEVSRLEAALASLAHERQAALEGAADGGAPVVTGGAPPRDVAELDPAVLAQELQRVRRMLAQLGSVNPFAIEEHRELADRLDGLTGQATDLRDAIESTTELIRRLESEIASRFDAAFAAIGAKFAEYCQLLFGGGSASLSLGESAEGDAAGGIEIAVRPPGKRLQRLSMLSGGERALTGVALLFAMLDVNPVPFCILDEVDAALDEANIGRFAVALRQLSSRIDFVVITHNRATIEIADTIYGVTMTDAAASKVVSLRLADLPVEVMAG
jgi:chromosome segregation protein